MNIQFMRWSLFLVGGVALIMLFVTTNVPSKELEEARTTLLEAQEDGAALYSPFVYSRAVGAFQSAVEEIAEQQLRWMWERDYSLAEEMLVWAKTDGFRALAETTTLKQEIRNYHGVRPSEQGLSQTYSQQP